MAWTAEGGDGEVEQAAYVGQQAPRLRQEPVLRSAHRLGQGPPVVGGRRDEADLAEQPVGDGLVELADELRERGAHLVTELVVAPRASGGHCRSRQVARQPPRHGETVEAGEELAGGEVAGRAEEDEDWGGRSAAGTVTEWPIRVAAQGGAGCDGHFPCGSSRLSASSTSAYSPRASA